MQSNIVLIDFESVQPASLAALVADHFRLKVFIGAMQTKLPVDLVTAIQQMGKAAEYIRIAGVGRNALDFHIAYYIGRLASDEPDAFFHIISRDTGFDPLVQHLKDNKISCGRWPTIEDIPVVKAAGVMSAEERALLFHSRRLHAGASRPRTEKTLRSAIASDFQRQLSEAAVSEIVSALQKPGRLSIENGKVVYAEAG